MMDDIVQYTNKRMQSVIDKFSDPLDDSTKNRVMLNLLIELILKLSLAFCIKEQLLH